MDADAPKLATRAEELTQKLQAEEEVRPTGPLTVLQPHTEC